MFTSSICYQSKFIVNDYLSRNTYFSFVNLISALDRYQISYDLSVAFNTMLPHTDFNTENSFNKKPFMTGKNFSTEFIERINIHLSLQISSRIKDSDSEDELLYIFLKSRV